MAAPDSSYLNAVPDFRAKNADPNPGAKYSMTRHLYDLAEAQKMRRLFIYVINRGVF